MVEFNLSIIKTEPMDDVKSISSPSNHLQNHNSNTLNPSIGVSMLLNNTSYKDSAMNGRCCDENTNCSKSQKENCPHMIYERKQATAKRLLKAIQSNDFEHLKRLLESKPDLNVLVNGQTVLHYCLLMGRDVNWAKQLVNCGANPNLSNLDGWHPIHLAAFNGLQDTLSYLIMIKNQYSF